MSRLRLGFSSELELDSALCRPTVFFFPCCLGFSSEAELDSESILDSSPEPDPEASDDVVSFSGRLLLFLLRLAFGSASEAELDPELEVDYSLELASSLESELVVSDDGSSLLPRRRWGMSFDSNTITYPWAARYHTS